MFVYIKLSDYIGLPFFGLCDFYCKICNVISLTIQYSVNDVRF